MNRFRVFYELNGLRKTAEINAKEPKEARQTVNKNHEPDLVKHLKVKAIQV